MKIGIATASLYHVDQPLLSLKKIKEGGFDCIDLNLSHFFKSETANKEGLYPNLFDLDMEGIFESLAPLKQALEQTKITVSQMHATYPVWFPDNDALNDYLLTVLDKSFAICKYFNCPAIVVHPVQGANREDEWELNLSLYRRLIPIVKKYEGVKCCLENLFVHQGARIIEGRLSNADEICRLHDTLNEEAGGAYFGICFDVGHANLTGCNIREYLRTLGDRLTVLHIHDNNGTFDQHLAPYSSVIGRRETTCDWNGFLQGLREIGYRGVLSFESDCVFRIYPAAVHAEVLKLISAIGRYWSSVILENK